MFAFIMPMTIIGLVVVAGIAVYTFVKGSVVKKVTVMLEENAQDGSRWKYKMSREGVLKEVSNVFEPLYKPDTPDEETPLTDSWGIRRIAFEAVEPGDVTIYFQRYNPILIEEHPRNESYTYHVDKRNNIKMTDMKTSAMKKK